MTTELRTKTFKMDTIEAPGLLERTDVAWPLFVPWLQRLKRECKMAGWTMGDLTIHQLLVPEGPQIHRGIDRTVVGQVLIIKQPGDGYCNYCGESGNDMQLREKQNGQVICDMCNETQGDWYGK